MSDTQIDISRVCNSQHEIASTEDTHPLHTRYKGHYIRTQGHEPTLDCLSVIAAKFCIVSHTSTKSGKC